MKGYAWVLLAILIAVSSRSGRAQGIDSYQEFEFQNVESGLYVDVTRGHLRPGIKLQLWTGNTTDAQLFRIDALPDTDLHRIYLYSPENGLLFLTARKPRPDRLTEGTPSGIHVTLETEADSPTAGGLGQGISPEDLLKPLPDHQRWRFEKVQGRADTYVIHSAGFGDMVLTASGGVRGSPLLLRMREASPSQHWLALKQIPGRPEGLLLERFRYFPTGKLRGKIHWHANSALVDYFLVDAFNDELGNVRSDPISKADRSWDIDFEPGPEARNKEWCFTVTAVNHRAGSDLENPSWDICEAARRLEATPVTYSKAVIENCHDDRIDVRIWVSVNGQAWQDRGVLQSQWSGSMCPATGAPKTIELESGASTWIKALDSNCGPANPFETDGSCHELTTPALIGSDATEDVYRIQLGTGS